MVTTACWLWFSGPLLLLHSCYVLREAEFTGYNVAVSHNNHCKSLFCRVFICLICVPVYFGWRPWLPQEQQKPQPCLSISQLKGNACKQELLWRWRTHVHVALPNCEEGYPLPVMPVATFSGVTEVGDPESRFQTRALPPPAAGTSQQSFGKLQRWNQSFLRLSEKDGAGKAESIYFWIGK